MSDSTDNPEGLTYRQAGVDIAAGQSLVARIKPAIARTHRPEVLGGLGGFAAQVRVPGGYRAPVLVSGTDGVGTKLLLALERGAHHGIGIDLVAMCANDVLAQGGNPLFFLDYYATGQLDPEVAAAVIEGIAAGCVEAGMALVGGETAEMPDVYQPGHYDLAGFCLGIAEADALLGPQRVQAGDVLLALPSSGPHANGFSLIRRLLASPEVDREGPSPRDPEARLGDDLLAPTRIYVRPVAALRAQAPIHAIAHITGGGLVENLPRILPAGHGAVLEDLGERPALFRWLQQTGPIAEAEMWRTFNNGIGLVIAVPAEAADTALSVLHGASEAAWRLGRVVACGPEGPVLQWP